MTRAQILFWFFFILSLASGITAMFWHPAFELLIVALIFAVFALVCAVKYFDLVFGDEGGGGFAWTRSLFSLLCAGGWLIYLLLVLSGATRVVF